MAIRRRFEFPPKDEPLRDDVSTFGALVGEVLYEQGGDALYAAVEAARRAAISRREGDPEGERALERVVGSLPPERAEELVRAFSTYFLVVNLVEKVHRIRRRRDYLRADVAQPGSLEEAFVRLRRAGVSAAGMADLLGDLAVEPVFTAHPTEATRRTLLEKQQAIARALVDRLDPSMTPPESRSAMARIRAEITAGWQTEEFASERPTVADEREHVLFYVTDVLYRVLPPFYEAIEAALAAAWGEEGKAIGPPPLLRFASWVGGDMDGNPNVTAETVLASLARHRELALGAYRRELLELAGDLSQSATRVEVAPAVLARAAELAAEFPEAAAAVPVRHRDMPYRVLLQLAAAKVAATQADLPSGYTSAEALEADLELVAASLSANRGGEAGLFAVRRTLRRIETFGFHLLTLDIRQDARAHRPVVGRLFGDPAWESKPAAERAERLRQALAAGESEPAADAAGEPEVDRALAVFRAIAECRRRYGARAIGPFIVSMTQGADDLLSVLQLWRWANPGGAGEIPLDVAPLFETVPDLGGAPETLGQLLDDGWYQAHLARRGGRQMVMVGYSDSNKDGGLISARWALQRAQQKLVAVAASRGVQLTFFHGRGGTVSRGGGKIEHSMAAAPRGSVAGRFRVTEQGQTIDEKFGLRGIAVRTLEQTVGAVCLATALPSPEDRREEGWQEIMEELAAASRAAYRELIYEDPEFFAYFRSATPIDVIERLGIGSRPASRRSQEGIENLRAIPWVFAWTQNRHLLPGWFGLGSGLEKVIATHGKEKLAEMAREWPFLKSLLEDAARGLAMTDLEIGKRYAGLAGDGGGKIFGTIAEELNRTFELLKEVQGTSRLLEDDKTFQRSIKLRNPYVDPMSLLQVDLLARWRKSEREDPALFRALVATVYGIARGLHNTG